MELLAFVAVSAEEITPEANELGCCVLVVLDLLLLLLFGGVVDAAAAAFAADALVVLAELVVAFSFFVVGVETCGSVCIALLLFVDDVGVRVGGGGCIDDDVTILLKLLLLLLLIFVLPPKANEKFATSK